LNAEFDQFAESYSQRLDDPLRERFASDAIHFHVRKLDLIQQVLSDRGLRTATMRWIDVGCGRGDLLKLGKELFASVAGCDISAEMLSFAGDISVAHQTDMRTLPFPSSSADFVTASCIFHHVEETEHVGLAREIIRILKPGGLFAIIEHNPLNPVTRIIVQRSPVDKNACLLTQAQAAKLIKSAGAEVVSHHYFLYLPEKLYSIFPRLERGLQWFPGGGQYLVLGRRQDQCNG
jgi:ubiquinone/menaquinone biosynthesis C-methylase UbiE